MSYNEIKDILEAMSADEFRWLFCADDPSVIDCACCLTSLENREKWGIDCGCVCHDRISAIAAYLSERL